MVLLFFATAVFLICLLWKIKVLFYAQVQDDFLRIHAELRLLFGVIRIPMDAETGICEMIGRRNKRKKKKKRPERKRFLRLLLSKGRENGALRLSSFTCRGLIGNADDAFLSVMGAGSVQVLFDMLISVLFPGCRSSVNIVPSFERNSIWIYMEGILEILPTQIMNAMIQRKGEGTI